MRDSKTMSSRTPSRTPSHREHHKALLDEDDEEDYSDTPWKKDRYFDAQTRQNSIHRERKRMFYGYFTGVLGIILLSAALVFSRALNNSVPVFELNGIGFMAQFFTAIPLLACCSKCHFAIETKYYAWLGMGSVFVIFSGYAKYVSALYLPLGLATGISLSLTVALSILFSCCSRRSARWFEILVAVVVMIGVILITQPHFLFRGLFVSLYGNNEHVLSPCGVAANPEGVARGIIDTSFPAINTPGVTNARDFNATGNSDNGTLIGFATATTTATPADNTTSSNHTDTVLSRLILGMHREVVGCGFCVMDALVSALHIVIVNKKLQGFNPFLYNAIVGFFGLVFCFLVMAFTVSMAFPPGGTCMSFLAGQVLTAGTFGLFQYGSFQMMPPVVSALLLVVQIPAAFLMELTAVSYMGVAEANVVEICGTAMVFMAILSVPMFEVFAMNKKMDIRKL